MKVLNQIGCAMIVFIAYCKMGYYTPFGLLKAFRAYFAEKQRLSGEVLSVTFCGIPLGTLLASPDNGALPVDKPFPEEMAKVRQKYKRKIGYYSKFAVMPLCQGGAVCRRLLVQAVTKWSFDHDVEAVVMIVHPDHAYIYEKMGAKQLAFKNETDGLNNAPSVLMLLVYNDVPSIKACRARYIKRVLRKASAVLAEA